ncbi:MAG: phospho-N-acetylmuramoyl-pentapeptide-transferase [Anaeroplasma sp.]
MVFRIICLFSLSIFLFTLYIRVFKKLGQYERKEGLKSHQKKNGTITMGGILFSIIPLFFISYSNKILPIIITSILYAILGFIDDLLIIIKKNNIGVEPTIKLIVQVIIAAISFFIYLNLDLPTILDLVILKVDIKWLFGLLMLGILTSSTNAFNLTDGVDGLCSGLCIIIHIAYMIIALYKKEYEILLMLMITIIPIFVFWCFNYPKAFLFMGDTGSLYLGSFYAMTAIYLNSILAFVILSSLFIFETLSVIIQVSYYKRTKKRVFKMAPFHHHLEAIGLKEYQIDIIFYLIEFFLVFIVLYFKLY